MAFKPSYNIMDRDTHNALVNAFKTGGIGYTDDDGTVHKLADDYVSGAAENKLLFISSTIENDTETLSMTWNDIYNALRSKTLVFLTFAGENAGAIYPIIFAFYEDGSYIVGVNRGTADGATIYTANLVNDYPAHFWD